MPLPSLEAREMMVRKLIEDRSEPLEYLRYAEMLDVSFGKSYVKDYSGSDIKLVCKEAAMKPLRRLMEEIESTSIDGDLNWNVAEKNRIGNFPHNNFSLSPSTRQNHSH